MSNTKPLSGKTALITGSTSGIGLAIAQQLASEGANIALNGFGDAAQIETLRRGLEQDHGITATYHNADMTKPAEIRDLCAQATAKFGNVDILVNSAGIQFVAPLDDYPEDKWDTIIAINLSSSFHTTKACLPGMRAKKWGRIINISSIHGLIASPFKSAYISAKHGIVGLTKTTALETATDGITCNAICPGYVDTPLVQNQIKDQAKSHGIPESEVIEKIVLQNQPTKKLIHTSEISGLTSFLCSPSAQNITGTAVSIDGGWTAR